MSRLTEVKIRQSISAGSTPDAAMALRPAIAAASLGRMPLFQNRRVLIPLISSTRPAGSFRRRYTGARRSSNSADDTSLGGSS